MTSCANGKRDSVNAEAQQQRNNKQQTTNNKFNAARCKVTIPNTDEVNYKLEVA